MFLTHNGLKIYEIEVINITAAESPQVLADGRVDAICTWEPNILNAKKLLGEDAILIPPTGGVRIFREDFCFVPNRNFAEHNPEALRRFLKTIEKGNELIRENKEEAITIVSQRLKTERGLLSSVRNDFEFQLVLDQSRLITLEDEAKWLINNNLTDKTEVPNYLDYVYIDALEEVRSEAVMIIR